MLSSYAEMKKIIARAHPGTLFFPDDFAEVGTSDAIRSALVRLCRSGLLLRESQGIYYSPKIDRKWGSGIIPPTMEDIAKRIAQRDKVRIVPTGDFALNLLGLSTQIPANAVFLTDGSPRRIHLGNGKSILFKHTSEMRIFAFQSEMMRLIVIALREIGEKDVTETQLEVIKRHLATVSPKDYRHDLHLAPLWVRKILIRIYNKQ